MTDVELIDGLDPRESPAARKPATMSAETRPAQAIPVWLEVDQTCAHLTQDWQATLCGQRLPSSVTWPTHYRRGDCSVCWQLAHARGLEIGSQT